MPLLVILFALLVPRVVILLLWLLTTWFEGIFATILWPILGFIILPTSFLWYSAVHNWFGGEWGIVPIIGIVIALLIDLTPAGRRR
jgi:hypothetical protein